MLDEPLGALDRTLREQLMNELRNILKRVGVTALYVTHDQEEAFAVADRVLIMRARPERGEGGWIEQEGTPADVYRSPQTEYVAAFLGFRNLLPGKVIANGAHQVVETGLGGLSLRDGRVSFPAGAPVTVLIRPEAASVRRAGREGREPGRGYAAGLILPRQLLPHSHRARERHVSSTSEVSASEGNVPAIGQPITLSLDSDAITLLRPES